MLSSRVRAPGTRSRLCAPSPRPRAREGVLFAVESGGWDERRAQTVLVREPLVRSSVPSMVVVSKPVLANGFAPQRIFAQRAPASSRSSRTSARSRGASSLEEGSGFVVDTSGVVLTSAHVIVSTSGGGLLTAAGEHRLRRSSATATG